MDLLPPPTPERLRDLRNEQRWSASQAAAAFWLADGRVWRAVESGGRQMDAARWTLGLLSIGRHPTQRIEDIVGSNVCEPAPNRA